MTLPLDGRRMHSRVTGRPALERSLRGLLIRLYRYGQHRATTRTDIAWTQRAIDHISALLTAAPEPEPRQTASAPSEPQPRA